MKLQPMKRLRMKLIMRYRVWNDRDGVMYFSHSDINPPILLNMDGEIVRIFNGKIERLKYLKPLFSTSYKCGSESDQEIYAGDLITNEYLESVKGCPVIIYHKRSVEQVTDDRSVSDRMSDLRRWHILGNVYEHPERVMGEEEDE